MEKTQKKAKKNSRNKKNQPLKVVYITNPIKFTTSAAEFRALVQELTGQYADTDATYSSASTYSAEEEAAKVAAEGHLHAEVEEEVMTELGRSSSGGGDAAEQDSCDPTAAGFLYDDSFVSSIMIESLQEWGQT